MNEITIPREDRAIQVTDINPITMIFDPAISGRLRVIAETMSKGRVTVPDHLRGNLGDCLAIVMQAATWRMNPFLVAQKTHLVYGILGYEAQLVNAVVSSLGLLEGRFHYEYKGDWRKIAVRPRIQKGSRGDYPLPGWNPDDETGLSVIVSAKIRGDAEPRELEMMLASAWPRNSGLWATDPQQQASYLAVKKWVRRYCPDAILGVYTTDELTEQVIEGERVEDEPSDALQEIVAEAAKVEEAPPEPELQSAPTPEPKPEKWPQHNADGELVDVRGIPHMDDVHAPSCTLRGTWRKRRGVDPETMYAREQAWKDARPEPPTEPEPVAKTQSEDPPLDDGETVVDPGPAPKSGFNFDQGWFNSVINSSRTPEELDECEDVLNGENVRDQLGEEVVEIIEGKLARRRGELMGQETIGLPQAE